MKMQERVISIKQVFRCRSRLSVENKGRGEIELIRETECELRFPRPRLASDKKRLPQGERDIDRVPQGFGSEVKGGIIQGLMPAELR
jgi:hypothetical protein